MSNTNTIYVMESVYARNESLAAKLNQSFADKGIFCTNILGAPGAGKTTVLTQILNKLAAPACIIEGDIESDIDTQKLKSLGYQTVQINTGGACRLDAHIVKDAFAGLTFSSGYLFIENIGNLVCPANYMIGEHVKLLICSVTDGSDKPYKYPLAFEKADIILLNKCDLLDYMKFDMTYFNDGIRKLNPNAPVFMVSGETGSGLDEVAQWLQNKAKSVIV